MQIGFRAVLAAGGVLAGLGALLMAIAHGREWEVMLAGAPVGAGVTFALGAMANQIVAAVPQTEVGIATGINTVMRITRVSEERDEAVGWCFAYDAAA